MEAPKLYETITAANWCKYSFGFRSNRRCLYGWLMARNLCLRNGEVEAAIRLLYPERLGTNLAIIPAFNDHHDTTVEDVIHVCKVADI